MHMYEVIHIFNVDGGHGNVVTKRERLGFVMTEEEAKEYCERYGKKEAYDELESPLYCHQLDYRIVNMLDLNKDPFEDDWFTEEIKQKGVNGNEHQKQPNSED